MKPNPRRRRNRHAFTLIELLVVIAIIALLVGILLPVLGAARNQARATKSLANTRSWGQGTILFSNDYNGRLPWEGEKFPVISTWTAGEWWANAVPPYVNERPYADIAATGDIPLPGDNNSIFIDPTASLPSAADPGGAAPYVSGGRPYFFCYVYNSKLDADSDFRPTQQDTPLDAGQPQKRSTLDQFKEASSTVIMLEKRTVKSEIEDLPNTPTIPNFMNSDLNTAFGDWEEFAGRHSDGGHMLFADGHGELVKSLDANRIETADHVVPANTGRNKPDLIWNPLGRGI